MAMNLMGKRVAVLAEDLYEDQELWYPVLRLRAAGAQVQIIGSGSAPRYHGKYGCPVDVDAAVADVADIDFDAVVIPGGYAPDKMRRYPEILSFVRMAYERGKVVAAICHGPWVLISAGILKGRTVTGFSAIKDDLVNAGAIFVDREVVRDGNIITSRRPDDLPAFGEAIIAALGEAETSDLSAVNEQTSAIDALRIAIRAEESAQAFYTQAMRRTKDPAAKNMFKQLAAEEARHREIIFKEYQHLTVDPDWDRYGIWREIV